MEASEHIYFYGDCNLIIVFLEGTLIINQKER